MSINLPHSFDNFDRIYSFETFKALFLKYSLPTAYNLRTIDLAILEKKSQSKFN